MESSRITTSFLCSTRRFAFSITISATCTWREAGSSKVEDTTSPFTDRTISVTSSGRSSRSEEHTSELQSRRDLVCRLLLEKKKQTADPLEGLIDAHDPSGESILTQGH